MVLMGTPITRDPTGAIGIGFTDTGATIEIVPSRSLSTLHGSTVGQEST
jgi:hypothetical protein